MRKFLLLGIASVAMLLLAGCGDDGESSEEASDADLVVLGEDIRFDEEVYDLPAGPATLEFRNVGGIPHNLVFEDGAVAPVAGSVDVTQAPGESITYQLELEPGSFPFFCSVPGHREAGMEAVLNVSN